VTDPLFYGKPLTFNSERHMYFWGGEHVPSVTTIIGRLDKSNLIQWAADMAVAHVRANENADDWGAVLAEARVAHRTIKEAAGAVGTRVHKYARGILEKKHPAEPLDGPAQKAIEAFWQWVEQHKIEPIAVERRVFSERYRYAGTCDFFGRIDGILSVLDFKTGNGVYDEVWWQTSGYEMALQEELHANRLQIPMARWVVHLNKTTGECVAHCRPTLKDWEQDRAVWLSLVEVDQALRKARKHPQPSKKKAA